VSPVWLVLAEGQRRRWGGDLRRAFVFSALAERTGGTIVEGWSRRSVAEGLDRAGGRRRPWRRTSVRPLVATAELLTTAGLALLRDRATPFALDVHDHPGLQLAALGVTTDASSAAQVQHRYDENVAAFPWLAVPSASFGDLAGIAPERRLVVPNGSDTSHVTPGPLPAVPTVGLVSGAAPGRGIDTLVDAVRLARRAVPELELRLWLAGSAEQLGAAAALIDGLDWARLEDASYDQLGEVLARATVLCVPHPPGEYMDVAMPVKLFDSMAAGRPVVVTPRREMRQVVEQCGAGLVTAGDSPQDIADALVRIVQDPALAAELGAAGRRAAVADYDWRVISGRLADELLRRVDVAAAGGRES
jgi:glycosyltransferase involved in cell wall biosynthesis